MVDLLLVVALLGASTDFFSSGMSTRFTVFRGSGVAGLAAAGATGVVTGVVVAVAAFVVSPLVVSVVSSPFAAPYPYRQANDAT